MPNPPPFATSLEQARSIVITLWAEVQKLTLAVQRQEARIRELEARLAQNSSNSSRPPSTDKPWDKPKRKPPEGSSGRKPGGQPGHKGVTRDTLEPDETHDEAPDRCECCGVEFDGSVPLVEAVVRQEIEIELARRVKEHRYWARQCPHCRHTTRAERPASQPAQTFGPRLKAVAALMASRFRMTRREAVAYFRDVHGVPLSLGSTQAICEHVSDVVAPAVEAVSRDVTAAPVVHADETGWKQKGRTRWLWLAATDHEAYFLLADNRGGAALAKLLPEDFEGVVHSDRWKPYQRFVDAWRQLCHAHLRRDFQALIDRGGSAKPIGERLLTASNRLFHAWHAFQRGELSRADLALELVPVRMHFGGALSDALRCDDRKAKALAKDLRRHWPALWTFVHTAGVEPTNNNAERTLRPAVLWRKGSFGTQSDAGNRFVERMLTVIHTAKRRGIPILDWLERACASPTPDLVLRPCLTS
jgi:transposase